MKKLCFYKEEEKKIKELLDVYDVSKDIRFVIEKVFKTNYNLISDGCTLVSELNMPDKVRHPACLGHDYLYHIGVPKSYADKWFYRANKEFKRPFRALIRYIGVVLFGWVAYNGHRKKQQKIILEELKAEINKKKRKKRKVNGI